MLSYTKKNRMKLLIFTPRYPGKHNSSDYVFVKQFVDAVANLGHECHVVAPYNILHYRKIIKKHDVYQVGNSRVSVDRPYYLSFSDYKLLGRLTSLSRRNAIKKVIAGLPDDIDVVYGHFWKSAYEGYEFAKRHGIPLFVATGESNIAESFPAKPDQASFCDYVKGVICVSSKSYNESISMGLTVAKKCSVFPNAVNNRLFRIYQRSDCRKILNIPQSAFVVVYVGWFNDRKGVLRVADAIKLIKGETVYSLFIGEGNLKPQCDNILYKGKVKHEILPQYLNAADVFVLPTKNEGCCNAIVEAMACGLPVISSDLPFNWDLLDDSNSIMIDPDNIEDISRAITLLRDDQELRKRLSEGSVKKAAGLTLDNRAKEIIDFIQEKMDQ